MQLLSNPLRLFRVLPRQNHFDQRLPCRLLAGLLIVAATGLHLAFLVSDCPLDLAPDEAHYWDWSRHLDWSYYSKGPLVAWLIRASCALFGDAMPAVRLPANLCGALLLVALYVLTVQVYRKEFLGLVVVAGALTMPSVWAASMVMTIDAPYICCWAWALVLAHAAIFGGRHWAWPAVGLVVGVGILAKYTMVLFLLSLGLFLLTSAEHRQLLRRPGFWVMTAVAGLCCLPILIWNIQNGWVSFRHVQTLAGMAEESQFRWFGPLTYVGQQFALLLGGWFIVWVLAMTSHVPWREPEGGRRYLWWLSAPMFLVFLLFSVRTGGGEINWPVTAYLSGLVLVGGWLAERFTRSSAARNGEPLMTTYATWQAGGASDRAPQPLPARRRLLLTGLAATIFLGLGVIWLMHFTDRAYPLLSWAAGPATPERPMPIRQFDPTCRLRGWRELATEVDRVRAELRAEGIDPVLAGSLWWHSGELAFYCADHPTVYCLGILTGSRTSQYDLWRPNPIADPAEFRGRTFVIVGGISPDLAAGFECIDATRHFTYEAHGQMVNSWQVTVCRGWKGVERTAGQGKW